MVVYGLSYHIRGVFDFIMFANCMYKCVSHVGQPYITLEIKIYNSLLFNPTADTLITSLFPSLPVFPVPPYLHKNQLSFPPHFTLVTRKLDLNYHELHRYKPLPRQYVSIVEIYVNI